jgi:hypothetical protein
MVGKPNMSHDGYKRPDLRGAARSTPGMTALDEEREASMADEGGAAGMVMESEDEALVPVRPASGGNPRRARLTGALLLGAAVGFAALWNARSSSTPRSDR